MRSSCRRWRTAPWPAAWSSRRSASRRSPRDWLDSPEVDFRSYRVYRSTDPDFVPSPADLVQETSESSWTDFVADPWSWHYRISAVDFSGNESAAGATEGATGAPVSGVTGADFEFALATASPNPFRTATTIGFSVPAAGPVRLAIYTVAGRRVRTLVDEVRTAGPHVARWDGRDAEGHAVASGVYLCRLQAGSSVQRKRMVLLK